MKTTIQPNSLLWQEARERVETYLLSYGMDQGEALTALIARVLSVAVARHQQEPWRDPVSLAAAETERVLHERVQRIAPESSETQSPHTFARARAALHLSKDKDGLAMRMLAEESSDDDDTLPPSHAADEMAAFRSGPEVRLSNMMPEPMHYDVVADVANETWRAFARWPVIRSSLNVMLTMTGVGTILYLANF